MCSIIDKTNEGDFDISNWSIVFESNYTIKDADEVEIIEQNQIKHIRCLDSNKYIQSKETVSFEIRVVGSEQIAIDANYRVYGIHSGGDSSKNWARRFTKDLYLLFQKNNWID